MMFVIGPAASGKRSYVASLDIDPACVGILDDGNDIGDFDGECGNSRNYVDDLVGRYAVLIGTEIGCGLVPVDASERRHRETVGRLHCLVAEKADTVVRLYCGIPQAIKGTLPLPGEQLHEGDGAV